MTSRLVEDARRHALREITDRTQLESMVMDDTVITVEKEVGDYRVARKDQDSRIFTPAYENRNHKAKCGLCKSYFHKKSMQRRVTNFKILQLQKSWNCLSEGKRFETSSFLYEGSAVCTFCYQLFDSKNVQKENDNIRKHSTTNLMDSQSESSVYNEPSILAPKTLPSSNVFQSSESSGGRNINNSQGGTVKGTAIERNNVAVNRICYQSSVVDQLDAVFAVTSPYSLFSKTRREGDAWWEISLERSVHIHSVQFTIGKSHRIMMSIVMNFELHEIVIHCRLLTDLSRNVSVLFDKVKSSISNDYFQCNSD